MIQEMIKDAKSAANSMVAKQAVRASVVVPFIIALGFATAWAALTLIEMFGQHIALLLLAGGFTVIGVLMAVIVKSKEQEDSAAEQKVVQIEAANAGNETASVVPSQVPIALIATLLNGSNPTGSVGEIARTVGRNLPLVALLCGLGILFWPRAGRQPATDTDAERDDAVAGNDPNSVRLDRVDKMSELHRPGRDQAARATGLN